MPTLLLRFWKPLAGLALLICAYGWAHHAGFESGRAVERADWQPRFAAAERARDEANAAAHRTEELSSQISQTAEAEHAKTVASLNLRAADAERRYADILRKHSASSRCGAVPQDGGAAGNPDATRASSELIDRTSKDFGSLARRCESDSAALTSLQEWIKAQQALLK